MLPRKIAGGLLAVALSAAAQQYRAFWADAFHDGYKSAAQVDRLLDDVAAARANAVFVEVRSEGGSYYTRSTEPPAQDRDYAPGFDALAYLIERAHARSIEVHAWFPVTPLWRSASQPADPRHLWYAHGPKAAGADMWMSLNAAGKASTSVDPGHPAGLSYLAGLITGVARDYDVDGLHLDYIRYPEDDDYGWNPRAVERFDLLANRVGSPARGDAAWSQFRRDQVTALVRQVYLRAIAIRPAVKISGALITWGNGPASDAAFLSSDAYGRVFQDWRSWMEEGIIDLAIPMNYFRESQYPRFLDRWAEFEKDRQYRRAALIGLGNYLNSIPDTLAQLRRVLAPSAAGNRVWGVNFYSYASTNATLPNRDFYESIANFFGDAAAPPVLPWKSAPERGHLMGWLNVDGGPDWLKDGATVVITSDTGREFTKRVTTDGSGFFGAVDLPPDRYYLRLGRGGTEVFRTIAQDIVPGLVTSFDIRLTPQDFEIALPRISRASSPAAAPGDVVTVEGVSLAASSGPAGTLVLVNGKPAPLLSAGSHALQLQLPFDVTASRWIIVVRRAGMESPAFTIDSVPANPVILAAGRLDDYVVIYATGLGITDPAVPAGSPGPGAEPFARTTRPVTVLIGDTELAPDYAGLAPFAIGRYQVNVRLPQNLSATENEVRLKVGDAVSIAVKF